MFEQLFGSKTRVKLMRLFLENPGKSFYVRELTRLTDSLINSVRRELSNLVDLKLVVEEAAKAGSKAANVRKYYYLNPKNLFQKDLLNLFLKNKLLVEKKFISRIKRLGDIRYFSLGGFFVEDEKASTDILLVGDFDKTKVVKLFNSFEKEAGCQINFTIMDENEFQLRKDIADSFLINIISNEKNIVVIDKIGKRKVM